MSQGDYWKSVGQLDLFGLSEDDECVLGHLSSCQAGVLGTFLHKDSQRETVDCVKDVDPDLIAVTLAHNLYDYDERDNLHDVRKQRSLRTEYCQIDGVSSRLRSGPRLHSAGSQRGLFICFVQEKHTKHPLTLVVLLVLDICLELVVSCSWLCLKPLSQSAFTDSMLHGCDFEHRIGRHGG